MTQFCSKCRKSAPAVADSHLNKPLFSRVFARFWVGIKYGSILKIGRDYKTFDSNRSDFPFVVIPAFL
ncbi:hypothetical protein PCAR4_570383 [Paraburkholderia caribensis]|nr:hypothetical protein PCAR4_570383 [Paraburkholderia caribensis]